MRRRWGAWVGCGCLVLSLQAKAAPEAGSPAAITQAMYRTALAHPAGFTRASLQGQKERLTPKLYAGLLKRANQPTPKDEAPDIEGDVFLDCQEPPTHFQVVHSTIELTRAKVEVILQWPREKRHYTVLFQQSHGAWKVCDIIYDKDGKLSDLLR